MSFTHRTEEYYKKFIELQEKLRKSEEERLKLEMKFNEMVQITREEEQMHYRKLRSQYKRFLEEDRRRQDRNDRILKTLERIDSRVAVLTAKTERFKLLRQQYNAFLERLYKSQTVKKIEVQPASAPPPRIIEPTSMPKFSEPQTYAKQLEEKNNILEKYLQDMSSQRLRNLLDKEEIARSRLPFSLSSDDKLENNYDDLYTYSDGNKYNYANSIADDIMNSIYSKQKSPEKLPRDSRRKDNISEVPLQTMRKSFEESESEDLSPNESNPSKLDLYKNVCDKKFQNSTESLLSDKALFFDGSKPAYEISAKSHDVQLTDQNGSKQKVHNQFLGSRDVEKPSLITDSDFFKIIPQTENFSGNAVLNDSKYEQTVAQIRTKITNQNDEEKDCSVKEEMNETIRQNTKNIASEAENPVVTGQEVQKDTEESEAREIIENLPNEDVIRRPYLEQEFDESEQLLEQPDNSGQAIQKHVDNQLYDQGQFQYDENKQLTQQPYDENGQPIQQQYDENGQVMVMQQQYDESDQLTHQPQYDENGQLIQQQYDENSQLIQQQYDENGQLTQQQYDENGQLIQYDKSGQLIRAQYDENGQLIQSQYDEGGQLIEAQYDENGQLIQQGYDESGQLIQQQYDENGHLIQQQYDENGQIIPPQYDENGQLIRQQPDENGQLIQQQYDENGQLIQEQYDEKGQLIQQQYDENGESIPAQYDENGQLIQQQYDENGQLIQQQYDENGQLIQQQYDENGQLIQAQYDVNGQLIQHQYDENRQSIPAQYDENGQLIQQQYDENGQLIQQQYDENGQSIQQQYDENGQLIQAQYDVNGQLIQHQYDENGQLIQAQYDENGQLIQTQYDENGQLIQAQYDENGQLIQQQYNENGEVIQPQYDGSSVARQYGEESRNAEADAGQKTVTLETEQNIEQTKTSKVMEMLDTDTESSVKQDTAKVSNESDFDFSNG